jgi:hypothetical protein
MGSDDFRRITLGLAGTIESAHMGHPDFRANGRIFATLHADDKFGMVKLTLDQQQQFVREDPAAFAPESGAWGRSGCTAVRLDAVDEDTLGEAMTLAWQNTVKKQAGVRKSKTAKPRRTMRAKRPSRHR